MSEQLPDEELTRRERTREMSGGIVGYAADDACGLLAFALSGQLWVARPADGSVRRLAAAGPVTDPRPDPAGHAVAYLSGGALRVISADGGTDRVIAAPEEPAVSYGRAEHVAAESMGRYRGYWWAPDGQRLLVARVDESPVQQWYRADPAEPGQPPAAFRYPPAGSANALVSLWIADAAGAGPLTAVGWDSATLEYLAAAGWDGSGPFAAVQRRDQRHVQVLGIDGATGATRVLAEQHDDAWVQLVPGLGGAQRPGSQAEAVTSRVDLGTPAFRGPGTLPGGRRPGRLAQCDPAQCEPSGATRPAEGDLMSSGTPPAGSAGLPGRHAWSIGRGLRATGRGLGFGALSLAGAGLLMALAAPLLLALPLLVTAATVVRRAHGPAHAFTVVPGGQPQPVPWQPPFELLVFTALLLLAGTVVWLLLLPRILRAVRQLAQLTRWLSGEWCGVRYRGSRPAPASRPGQLRPAAPLGAG